MHKSRVTLSSTQIRKANTSLRNWANEQKSDELYYLLKSHLISTTNRNGEKVVLKGTMQW